MKFNIGHLPRGTAFEYTLTGRAAEFAIVRDIYCNGPNSFILETRTPGTVTDFISVNLTWVTRILARGTGSYAVSNRMTQYGVNSVTGGSKKLTERRYNKSVRAPRIDQEYKYQPDNHLWPKAESVYVCAFTSDLLYRVLSQFTTDNMLVDFDKLKRELNRQGLFKKLQPPAELENEWCITYGYSANKKKLKNAVRRLINKCLVSRKAQQEKEDKEQEDDYFKDMGAKWDWDYDKSSKYVDYDYSDYGD